MLLGAAPLEGCLTGLRAGGEMLGDGRQWSAFIVGLGACGLHDCCAGRCRFLMWWSGRPAGAGQLPEALARTLGRGLTGSTPTCSCYWCNGSVRSVASTWFRPSGEGGPGCGPSLS